MAYSVTKLITDAYKLSSLVSREFEEIQGYQLNDGLEWFNQLLADTGLDYGAIPYITTYYEFNCVPGQEKYYLRNLLDIQSCVFFIQAIRYEMKYISRKAYFGLPRANNISALPLSYTYERAPHGVNLFVYFYPQEPYVIQIVGNMYVNFADLNQDLHAATANLGDSIQSNATTFTLLERQLVINDVDLQGTYTTVGGTAAIQALVNYINTGTVDGTGTTPLIQYVTASIQGTQFTLQSEYGPNIQVKTNGIVAANSLNFSNFPLDQGVYINTYYAMDGFWTDFWMYSLADRICQMFNMETPDRVTNQLNIYRQRLIKDAETVDLSGRRISVLGRAVGINYAAANIGRGFTTSGY